MIKMVYTDDRHCFEFPPADFHHYYLYHFNFHHLHHAFLAACGQANFVKEAFRCKIKLGNLTNV
jgi:hypothetical protein